MNYSLSQISIHLPFFSKNKITMVIIITIIMIIIIIIIIHTAFNN